MLSRRHSIFAIFSCILITVSVILFQSKVNRGTQKLKYPLVIIIVYDTLRADHLGCYGNPRAVSPNLDRFASEGTLFESAVSLSSWTKPSTTTLLTSLSPSDHEVGYFKSVVPKECIMLSSVFRDAGYETYGFSANVNIDSKFGFDQGFDIFEKLGSENSRTSNTQQIFQKAVDLLDQSKHQFIYLHLIGPHAPYCPPAKTQMKIMKVSNPKVDQRQRQRGGWFRFDSLEELDYLRGLYDAEILAEDVHFGWFVKELRTRGLYDKTLVVFTSDHGEAFYEHEQMEHGNNLFHEEIHVPLMIRGPGVPSMRRREIVGLHDVAPTILSLIKLPVPESFQGVDLFSSVPADRVIRLREFREDYNDKEWYGVIARGMKAVWDDSPMNEFLFCNWRKDAFSQNQAALEHRLFESLKELGITGANASLKRENTELDEKTMQELRSLGYLE